MLRHHARPSHHSQRSIQLQCTREKKTAMAASQMMCKFQNQPNETIEIWTNIHNFFLDKNESKAAQCTYIKSNSMHSLFDGLVLILLAVLHLSIANAFIRNTDSVYWNVWNCWLNMESYKIWHVSAQTHTLIQQQFSARVVLWWNVECFMVAKMVGMVWNLLQKHWLASADYGLTVYVCGVYTFIVG